MSQPDEHPRSRSKDPIASRVAADLDHPSVPVPPGATRKGHSNGLKVHSIVFGSLALGALVALLVAFIVIAGDKM